MERLKQQAYRSLLRPIELILPFTAVAGCFKILSIYALKQLEDGVKRHGSSEFPKWFSNLYTRANEHIFDDVLQAAAFARETFSDITYITIIVMVILMFYNINNVLVQNVIDVRYTNSPFVARIIIPLSQTIAWVLIGVGIISCFQILDINLRPLLAVGGLSSAVIGFASQSVLANVVNGVTLVLTRPILPGDQVELRTTTGASVMKGQITKFDFLRTTIRLENNQPVLIPNKLFADYIIVNETLKSLYASQFNTSLEMVSSIELKKDQLDAVADRQLELVQQLNLTPGKIIQQDAEIEIDTGDGKSGVLKVKAVKAPYYDPDEFKQELDTKLNLSLIKAGIIQQ